MSPDNGIVRITTPVNESALPECAQNSPDGLSAEIFFFNKSGDAESHGKDLLSLALAAFISDAKIQLTYSDLYCVGSRANVSRIDLIK